MTSISRRTMTRHSEHTEARRQGLPGSQAWSPSNLGTLACAKGLVALSCAYRLRSIVDFAHMEGPR